MFNWLKSKKSKETGYLRPSVAIRLEAIGGQGANSAGKILAEAAVLKMKYTGNHFSSFGSEKRGTPVRSFIRFSTQRHPVRTASFIKSPDLLVIFHENLMESHPEILAGLHEHSIVILNTSRPSRDIHLTAKVTLRKLITLDATRLAHENQCGINAVMLGALESFLPEIGETELLETLTGYFHSRGEVVQKKNQNGFKAGQKLIREMNIDDSLFIEKESSEKPIPLGWENAPLGGVILNPGNMLLKDHTASRKGFAPSFLKDVCFNCGYCDMVCPDFCFVWGQDSKGNPKLQGIDYQYCKACQKCIEVCPVKALVLVPESEITAAEKSVSINQDLRMPGILKSSKSKI